MVGVAGSGKTTYVRKMLPDHAYVSMDKLQKEQMWPARRHILIERYEQEQPLGENHPNSRNKMAECVLVDDALRDGKDTVIDDTNLTQEIRRPYILLARKYDTSIRAIFFWDARLARIRNAKRKGKERVPEDVITGQIAQRERPHDTEGFDSVDVID